MKRSESKSFLKMGKEKKKIQVQELQSPTQDKP